MIETALLKRISELEDQIAELKAAKAPKRVKHVYGKLNPLAEKERFMFILERDGLVEGIAAAKSLIKTYIQASLKTRQKFHTRSYPFRFTYIESAYSIRHLLRTKFSSAAE
jgi:hypothetical protein